MLQALINTFRVPELRNKILFTLGLLAVYRIGFWIPLPGVDQTELAKTFAQASQDDSALARAGQFIAMFSGGAFSHSTIFGLGIMPYISASIIFQLLTSVIPSIKKLQEEGASGRQKLLEWQRYATIGLCIVQAIGWLKFVVGRNLVYAEFANNPVWWVMAVAALTAGTVFLMWLGEQIDKYGIGNGVSLILTAGIISRIPHAIDWIRNNFDASQQADPGKIGLVGVLFLIGSFVFVVAGAIVITVAQRRIPIQQAKQTRGRKVYGGQKHYLPLRVNHAGVMPIIFASSLLIFPSAIFGYLNNAAGSSDVPEWWRSITIFLNNNFQTGEYPYVVLEILMIYFFSYFWTTVVFSPEEMAKQLRDNGSFIPGLRPGPRTAEYLETVVERVTYAGAGFLAVIAVIPSIVSKQMGIPYFVAAFLGGTGLLIVVSVALDLMQRIEANLLMRNYAGFLSTGEAGRAAPKLRSRRA
ncbi:MAG: preprotein translocase subunit SecY [Phycisphaerales bacterium]